MQLAIAAITAKKRISFQYFNENLQSQVRKIAPYAVASQYGHWYLYGQDLEKGSLRSFRLDRIASDIQEEGKSGAFEIPESFQLRSQMEDSDELLTASLYLRTGRALSLRSRAANSLQPSKIPGWDLVSLTFRDRERLIEELLWYGDDVVLHSPQDLRDEIILRLENGVKSYG